MDVKTTRMASVAMEIGKLAGVHSELVSGPFPGSDMQLMVKGSSGVSMSVMPDADMPGLFEIVVYAASGDELRDKLPLAKVVEVVERVALGGRP
jgi:hypothetical protein